VGEGQGNNNARGEVERVTIAEAATLLGCHANTVRSRVKVGIYRAEKVLTENGPKWMIDRDSLTTNAPASARQQPVSGVPAGQQEAIQELARAIVREAGIAQEPEAQATLEANKMAMEAAKTQILIGSGLLVGMTAVVGVLPKASLDSPLLYVAFGFVILSVYGGLLWLREIAAATARSEMPPVFTRIIPNFGGLSTILFSLGLAAFVLYVLWNSPGPSPDWTPREQAIFAGSALLLGFVTYYVVRFLMKTYRARRSGARSEDQGQEAD